MVNTVIKVKNIRIRLDKTLEQAGITRNELATRMGTKFQTVDNYYKNRVVRYDSDLLVRMCIALNCNIEDIIEIIEIPDSEPET